MAHNLNLNTLHFRAKFANASVFYRRKWLNIYRKEGYKKEIRNSQELKKWISKSGVFIIPHVQQWDIAYQTVDGKSLVL